MMANPKKRKTVSQAEIRRMVRLHHKYSIEKVAEILDREIRTVRKYLGFTEAQESKGREAIGVLNRNHIENTINLVELIRSCLEHPTLNELPDGRELLELRGHDWRLDSTMWFYLCTPDFSQKHLWGAEFPLLESHMKDSSFWQHLEQLSQAVKMLEDDYNRIAVRLSNDNRRLGEFWKSIQLEKATRETEWGHKPSRTPHKPKPAEEEFQPYYDEEYGKEIMGIFNTAIPDLKSQQVELEKLLEQLHTDLLIDNIGDCITKGKCGKCP